MVYLNTIFPQQYNTTIHAVLRDKKKNDWVFKKSHSLNKCIKIIAHNFCLIYYFNLPLEKCARDPHEKGGW